MTANDSSMTADGNDSIAQQNLSRLIAEKQNVYRLVIPPIVALYVLTIAINFITLLSVRWIKGVLSPTLKLTISLLISDMWTSLVSVVSLFMNSYLPVVLGIMFESACLPLAFEAFRTGGILSAVSHLLVMSFNHYLSILIPFRYNSVMTPSVACGLIVLLWFTPPVALLLHFSVYAGHGFQSPYCLNMTEVYHAWTPRITISALFFIPLVIMTAIYIHILFLLVRMHYALRGEGGQNNSRNVAQLKKRKNTIKTAMLIVLTFVIGWMPTSLLFALICPSDCPIAIDQINPTTLTTFYIAQHCCIIFKTCANPVIYAVRIPEINDALLQMLDKTWLSYLKGHTVIPNNRTVNNSAINNSMAVQQSRYQEMQTLLPLKETNNLNGNHHCQENHLLNVETPVR